MARRLGFLLLVLVPLLALAQSTCVDLEKRLTPEPLHATGLDTLSPAQLALLNQLLRNDANATASPTAAVPATAAGGPAVPPPTPLTIGLQEGPVHSRLVGSLEGWEPGTVFVLANGQKRKVLKGRYRLCARRDSPEVEIVPGVAGRWFLQLDEDTSGPRVYRIE